MHTDTTAVTIQSNRTVSNGVEDNSTLLRATLWDQTNFVANPMPVHGAVLLTLEFAEELGQVKQGTLTR